MKKALILDANQRSALAATRSLGKHDIHVVVADEMDETLSGSSKYCDEKFIYPSPSSKPEEFISTLNEEIKDRGIKTLLPMTEITTSLILNNREKFTDVNLPYPDFESFDSLTNKYNFFKVAKQLGLPIPKTYFVSNKKELIDCINSGLEYPIVIKPSRSRIITPNGWISTSVQYAYSDDELLNLVANSDYLSDHDFLLQSYIKGHGQGIFALYENGAPRTYFAHKRIREKPPTGGVSVLSESVSVDQYMQDISEKILRHTKWHGIAMVEFKVTPKGEPYLMEVNARFWGSLQLAIDAGVDFPYLLFQLANGEPINSMNHYKIGVKNRWLLGDLDSLYILLKSRSIHNVTKKDKLLAILKFLFIHQKGMRYEINRFDDFRPFLFELKNYLRSS